MVARQVCLFSRNDFISAAAGPPSCMPILASGFESQGACTAAEVRKEAQRG
jgi:hypothetical protein